MYNWQKELPSSTGFYWFLGMLYGNEKTIRLEMIEVNKFGHFIAFGAFFNQKVSVGLWSRVKMPEKLTTEQRAYIDSLNEIKK